jgi:hypothetical protein
MSTTFRVDYVEAALLALLNAGMPAAYATELSVASAPIDINSLGDEDFNEDGQLVLNPPSMRLRFLGAPYNNLRDSRRLTYQTEPNYELWCYESSLRSKADERKQTLVLVSVAVDQLAGARINLQDGAKSMPITIVDVRLVETQQGPVDQLFSILFAVEGIAQFSGVNAQLP